MSKKVLYILIFALMLVFSVSAAYANDNNITDSTLSFDDNASLQMDVEDQSVDLEPVNSDKLSKDADDFVYSENNKNQTELSSPTKTIYYKGTYAIQLKDSSSNSYLANKTVNIVINNFKSNPVTDSNGVARVNLNLMPGEYKVSASFSGDDALEDSKLDSTLKILPTIKSSDISKYYNGNKQFTAQFFTSYGNALSNKMVTVIVDGKSYSRKTDNNGFVRMDINFKPGNYKIIAIDPVTGYKSTTTFKILSTISSSNLKKVETDNRKFSAKFFKSNGNALAYKIIKFKLKGKIYKVKTNKNGIAKLSLKNLKKGKYFVKCYNRDGLSGTYKIKVFERKAFTKLKATSYLFLINERKEIKVKLITALGDYSCSNKKIKIRIDGNTYSKWTNSNGNAYLQLPYLNKGLYTVEYIYYGDKYFKPSKSTKLLTIIDTSNTKLTVKSTKEFGYGAGTLLKVAYTAGDVPLAKKTITLNIGGKKFTRTTNMEGKVLIPINLKIGKYAVDYNIPKSDKLDGTSGSFEIKVFKRTGTKIIWLCGKSYKDNLQVFKFRVTDSKGKPISGGKILLSIDSKLYQASISSKGFAKIKTDVALGKYKVAVKYKGNNNYLPKYRSKNVYVDLSVFGNGVNERNAHSLREYLVSSSHCDVGDGRFKSLVKHLTRGLNNDVDKAKAIFNYVRDTLEYSYYYDTRYGSVATLNNGKGNCVDHSHLLVALYRTAGLNARYVHGTCHFSDGDVAGHVWTQVKLGDKWVVGDAISSRNSLGKIKNWNTNNCNIHGKYASLPF